MPGTARAATDSGLMSIGAVLNALRDEFPDVTISKIRFLESEGLVEPRRTPAGYRKFSAHDVERLGQVLRMQRDHYLPLKVIREHLDAMERGEAVPLPTLGRQRDGGGRTGALRGTHGGPDRAGRAARRGPDRRPGAEGVGVVRAPRSAARRGVRRRGGHRGLTGGGAGAVRYRAAHLRVMKAAADREAGLVDQVVAPLKRHRNPQTRAHAEARTKELAGLAVKLHAALVQTALGVRLP